LASLKHGFEYLELKEIISFTAIPNMRSQAVMQKIGMHHQPGDFFDHPTLPEGHRLKKHIMYRLEHLEWKMLNKA